MISATRMLPALLALLLPFCRFAAAGEKEPRVLKHEGWVAAAAFSPDGKTLATAGADKVVRLWDLASAKQTSILRGYDDGVCALAFVDERTVITGSFRRPAMVRDFDSEPKALAGKRPADLSVAVHRKKGLRAMGSIDGTVRIAAPPAHAEYVLRGHKTWVNSLAFNPDGSLLASGSSDGTVRLWETQPWGKVAVKELAILKGGAGEVRAVAFSPDGNLLAAGNRYGSVRIWDVAKRQEIKTLTGHAGDVWAIAFSPDGKTLAAADTDWRKPSRIKLWDTKTWNEGKPLSCPGEILCLAFSPDGQWLAAGSWDRTVRLFPMKP